MTGPIEIALHVISGKREASIDETPIDYINLYHRAWNDEASLLSNINEIHNKFNDMKMEPFVDIDNISNQDFKTI
ncbi:12034_t:CDS:1, partial [Gigaspora rosea]